jgi:hypothetical protein
MFYEQLELHQAVSSESYVAGKYADYGRWIHRLEVSFDDLQGLIKAYF